MICCGTLALVISEHLINDARFVIRTQTSPSQTQPHGAVDDGLPADGFDLDTNGFSVPRGSRWQGVAPGQNGLDSVQYPGPKENSNKWR